MRGLGLGPDASGPTQYLMQAIAPMSVDELRAAMDNAGCLSPELAEAMVTCFSPNLQPGNVSVADYNSFCLKHAAAGSFDRGGCEPAVTNWLDGLFPLPQCFDEPTLAAFQYCGQHPDYDGPNRVNDAACWLAKRSGSYALRIYGTPACGAAEDGSGDVTVSWDAEYAAYAAALEAQAAVDAAAAAQAAADAAAAAQADAAARAAAAAAAAAQAAANAAAAAQADAATRAAADAAAAAQAAANAAAAAQADAATRAAADAAADAAAAAVAADQAAAAAAAAAAQADAVTNGDVTNGEEKKRSSMMLPGLLLLGVVGVGVVYMVARKK